MQLLFFLLCSYHALGDLLKALGRPRSELRMAAAAAATASVCEDENISVRSFCCHKKTSSKLLSQKNDPFYFFFPSQNESASLALCKYQDGDEEKFYVLHVCHFFPQWMNGWMDGMDFLPGRAFCFLLTSMLQGVSRVQHAF